MKKISVFQVIPSEKYSYFQFTNINQTLSYISAIRLNQFTDTSINNLKLIKNKYEGNFATIEISSISIAGDSNVQKENPEIGKWVSINGNSNYKVLLPEVVNALDMKESEFDYFKSGRIMRIKKYVFDTKKLLNKYLFILPEITSTLLVTDLFLKKYKDYNYCGLEFQKIFEGENK